MGMGGMKRLNENSVIVGVLSFYDPPNEATYIRPCMGSIPFDSSRYVHSYATLFYSMSLGDGVKITNESYARLTICG